VTGLTAKGFSELTALDVWVTSKKANNDTGLPFTIDSFAFDQYGPQIPHSVDMSN
jgi:hypothetical protein